MRLEHPLVETEALRRRRATHVTGVAGDARVDRATADIMGWSEYVVAPVAVRSTVVAVLHADVAGDPLDARDAGILWTFATGLAQAYESASLRRTLRHERRQMRRLLGWIDARSSELADATVELVPRERADSLPQPEELDGVELRADRDRNGSAVLDAVLTRREIEILRLLADGPHEPSDRRRARDLGWNREVPRQQHPAQAARGEPRRGRRALLRAPGLATVTRFAGAAP